MRRFQSNNLNNLWICRKKVGLPQKSVARLLGHHTTSPISEYETGRWLPNLRTAFKLAAIYNVLPTDLYADLYQDVLAEVAEARKSLAARRETPGPSYDSTRPSRIMAVDPGVQHLGVAILEGEDLIWYGVKTFPSVRDIRSEVQRTLTRILRKYEPTVLVVEEPFYASAWLSPHLLTLTGIIKVWGQLKGMQVKSYSPIAVKAFFCRDQKTKRSLAEAMIVYYPFLARYLSPLSWRCRYWFHIFDPVALGLCASKESMPGTCRRPLARAVE